MGPMVPTDPSSLRNETLVMIQEQQEQATWSEGQLLTTTSSEVTCVWSQAMDSQKASERQKGSKVVRMEVILVLD